MNSTQTFTTSTSSTDTLVLVENLTKKYGDAVVVDDMSFAIKRGQVVGLLGPNGAGKTTAMKMLVGLVQPSAGDIELLGTNVGSRDWGPILARTGSMIEGPPLYEKMTARQNLELQSIAVSNSIDSRWIEEILALVGLSGQAEDKAGKFSLGMKQRLGIGVTLVGRPELIILDEPANGLDPAGIIEIRSLLRRLPGYGTTVLVSSHQLAEVQQACDELIVLDQGRIVAAGTTSQIIAAHGDNGFDVTTRPADTPIAVATITDQFGALGVSVRTTDAGVITIGIDDPANEPITGRDINVALTQADIYAETIARRDGNLEQAFLGLTTAR